MDSELKQALLGLLSKPKSYSVDNETLTNQSLPDMVALAKYLQSNYESVSKNPWGALKRCRFMTYGCNKQ